ncbi:alpha-L-rhamnosidase-related protein [Marinigracilibium pacificum]|uniref:Glycogen debranching protein n=1 Tax=Marinigracilibium pacificum TaxID=2729599 RepID=A0A848IX74_9BACT|nr:glycogen debranching protein [Marinigracilibium pacificum]NMM48256.1 glycogen debranching protein [Marinigracilibium pacificum]
MSCQDNQTNSNDNTNVLYQSDEFTIYTDKVVQGNNIGEVVSEHELKSNYKSPASQNFSRQIKFKFSINEKDNEFAPGTDHIVVINDEHSSPIITFGKQYVENEEVPENGLPINYNYTIKVDLTPIFKSFEEKGYFEAFDGTRIAKEDYKGVYIAGNSDPLSWDFVNLDNKGLKLEPTNDENIYKIDLVFNPYNESEGEEKSWKLSQSLIEKPNYSSDQPIVDALFNMSLEEAILNIEPDSTLRTGAKWGGVWTRDVSYSIFLAFAYHEPEVAKISLLKKVKRDRIIQDTGSGGAWPVSSDRTTWTLAAWELYKITGDREWLEIAYKIIKNTLEDDYKTLFNSQTGLFKGESSFLDWREQTYPKWMDNRDIYYSENLGTNVVHYQAHIILSEMAKELGYDSSGYIKRAEIIKDGINKYLWMKEKDYYGQYLYGRPYLNLSPRFEALGSALAVIFEVADENRAAKLIARSPLTPYGVTCIYPQIPGIPPYHNNGIWPFVQSYWNLAAAKAGNETVLNHGLASLYRAGGLFLTNYENFVAESGDYKGTEINSHRMLWSMAGNLAMVHRVFIGMNFETNGITFSPVIPENYGGKRKLENFKYRNAVLDITVTGYGNKISKFIIDGKESDQYFFDANLSGKHTIEIDMSNEKFDSDGINLQQNQFSLPAPRPLFVKDHLEWNEIAGAKEYLIYKNGEIYDRSVSNTYPLEIGDNNIYKVSALDSTGYESFTSEPFFNFNKENISIVEFENNNYKRLNQFKNYSGDGYIEISNSKNKEISITISIKEESWYLIDFRYSNGSGPWNTDNNCAIRSFYIDNTYKGVIVLPQRGTDEWSDWGYSNMFKTYLSPGEYTFRISFNDWNTNMDGEINMAMLDHIRLINLDQLEH